MRDKVSDLPWDTHFLDFTGLDKKDVEQLEHLAAEMQANFNRILPGFLERPADADVLSDQNLRRMLSDRWGSKNGWGSMNDWEIRRDEQGRERGEFDYKTFQQSVLDALWTQRSRRPADGEHNVNSTVPALTQLALLGRKQLRPLCVAVSYQLGTITQPVSLRRALCRPPFVSTGGPRTAPLNER